MTDKIQQARRAAFESYFSRMANSHLIDAKSAWLGFNAALDCVVIELPSERAKRPGFKHETLEDSAHNNCRDLCIDAIESTNLGIKVK